MEVGSLDDRPGPVRVLVARQVLPLAQHILKIALPAAPSLVGGYVVQHGILCCMLKIKVKRGVNAQAGAVHLVDSVLALQLPPHLFDEVWSLGVRGAFEMQTKRRGHRGRSLLLGDLVVLQHLLKDEVAPLQGAIGMPHGRELLGTLGQRREQRSLRQCEIARMFGEVGLGAGFEAVRAAAEVDLIRVKREDLLLGKVALDLQREEDLLQLASVGLLRGEEEVARELHGDGGCPLRALVGVQVGVRRTNDSNEVHAAVRLEVLVLDGEDGLAKHWWKFRVRHNDAALQREGAEDFPVNVVELGGRVGAVALEIRHLRDGYGEDHHQRGHNAQDSSACQQHEESGSAGELRLTGGGVHDREAAHRSPQWTALAFPLAGWGLWLPQRGLHSSSTLPCSLPAAMPTLPSASQAPSKADHRAECV